MNTVDGYAISSWERGYGDMMFDLDLATLRRTPGQPCSATVQCDLSWLDGSGPVRPVARGRCCRPRSTRPPSSASSRSPAPSSSSSSSRTPTSRRWDRRYQGLTGANRYNVDYSILGRHQGRAAAARDPQRDVCRRASPWRARRGSATPASTRSPSSTTRSLRTCDNHVGLQDRGQGDRGRARQVADLHGQVRRARGQLLPHPPVAARRGRRDGLRRRQPRRADAASCSTTSSPASRPRCASFTLLYAPNINSYKRFQPGSFAPDRHRLGHATTAPARCGSSGTVPGCGSRTASPAAT